MLVAFLIQKQYKNARENTTLTIPESKAGQNIHKKKKRKEVVFLNHKKKNKNE
jgi:hypothetical protein